MNRVVAWVRVLVGAAFAATALHPPDLSAQTGIVVGSVRDQTTGQPLEAARIQIGTSTLGGSTDARGHFFIRSVPAGPHVVRATRIGYRPASQTVTARAGDSVTATFDLAPSAVELSAVVTTGTGGAIEKQRIGSSLAIVDMSQVQEQVPVGTLENSLAGKVAGVRVALGGGGAGGTQDLRIRGIASFSLDQRPVIYIDGIRVDKSRDEWTGTTGAGGVACCAFAGGNSVDRLNDLDPADIDRVEVLKGAAAATLYGSDATNGVIQIFTKHGKTDSAPLWNVSYTGGYDRLRSNMPTTLFPRFTGTDGTRARDANTLIGSGVYSNVDMGVQGGGLRNTYYLSTGYMDEEGSIQPNWQRRYNLRVNLSFLPSEKWTIEGRSMFTHDRVAELQAGNNWTALLGNAINGNPRKATQERPFGEAWISVADIKRISTFSDANRWTGGITVSYAPRQDVTSRLIVGLDVTDEEKSKYFPWDGNYGPAYVTGGQKNEGFRKYSNFTADWLNQWHATIPFLGGIGSDFSFGGQGFWEQTNLNLATGNTFAGPGVTLVGTASIKSGGEGFAQAVNIGGLAQERLSFGERLFLTGGIRVDGNTAFGENFGFKVYPKVDVAWLLTGYSWLPKAITSLKLRSAIGRAGKAPGAFDKFNTFAPITVFTGTPAVVPLSPGNPDIRPETSTEREHGFEAGLFGDRLGIDASYYFQITKDALLPYPTAPSVGYTSAPNRNVGAIQNTGWEASINILAIAKRDLEWTTSVRADGNHNKIVDMGGLPQVGNTRIGYPVQGIWDRAPNGFKVVNGKPVTTRTDTTVFFGPPLPTFNAAWSNTIRRGRVSLYWNITMSRGAVFSNADRPYRVRQGGSDEYLKWLTINPDGTWSTTFQADSVLQYMSVINTIDSRDNVRFKELSLTWQVPPDWTVPNRLGTMSITLSGLNLYWWDHCHCLDPDLTNNGGASFSFYSFLNQPSPMQYRLAIRSRF